MRSIRQPQETINFLLPSDIVLGRGQHAKHEGNNQFVMLVRSRADEYYSTTEKSGKDRIARRIVKDVQNSGGRFVRKARAATSTESGSSSPAAETEVWEIADQRTVLVKIKQTFRDYSVIRRKAAAAVAAAAASTRHNETAADPPVVAPAIGQPQRDGAFLDHTSGQSTQVSAPSNQTTAIGTLSHYGDSLGMGPPPFQPMHQQYSNAFSNLQPMFVGPSEAPIAQASLASTVPLHLALNVLIQNERQRLTQQLNHLQQSIAAQSQVHHPLLPEVEPQLPQLQPYSFHHVPQNNSLAALSSSMQLLPASNSITTMNANQGQYHGLGEALVSTIMAPDHVPQR